MCLDFFKKYYIKSKLVTAIFVINQINNKSKKNYLFYTIKYLCFI